MEYRLKFAGRTRDDLQHLRGRGLLLQRFAQLVEQAGGLDGDDGLIGKVLDQRDLLVSEWAHLPTKDADSSDGFVVLEHRHTDIGPNAAKLDRIDSRQIAFSVSSRRCEISSVKRSLGSDDVAKRIAVAGMDDLSAFACFGKGGWYIVCGDRAKPVSLIEKEVAEFGLAEPDGIRQHRLKHRLQIARRRADDAQYLGRRRLLLQHLGEFLFQVGVGCAKTVNVSSHLRCLRTKTGNASSALRPFASQDHLVGTVTGPFRSGQPRIEPTNPSRTAR